MDFFELFKILVGPVLGFIIVPSIVWAYRKLEKRSDELQTKQEDLEKRITRTEARQDVMEERVSNIIRSLDEIKNMLRQLLNKNG
jgi:phosphopantothenate synthetase